MTVYKMAIHKESGELLQGHRGQIVTERGNHAHSIAAGNPGTYRKDYEFVEVDTSLVDGVKDYELRPIESDKIFRVHTVETPEDEWEYPAYELNVNGRCYINIGTPEPEDATLHRDLSFVYDIPGMLKAAYEAGKAGHKFELTEEYGTDF